MSTPPPALPVGVEPLRVPADRVELAGLRAGPPAGPAVVLVPGFTGSKEDFLPVLPLLADQGWSVLAIDQRGQYESPAAARSGDYTAELFRDDLLGVLHDLGPAHVVGHSFGGQVSRAAALARPDLVTSLTFLDSGPGPLPGAFRLQLGALRAIVPLASLDQIWQLKEALDRETGVPLPPADVQEFLHRRWLGNDKWSLAGMADLLMTATDTTDELAAVTTAHGIPLAVMYGADDVSAWPVAEQRDMARRLGVAPVEIPAAAHSPAVENPQRTAEELVAFLTSARV